jgi:hypothetical protein
MLELSITTSEALQAQEMPIQQRFHFAIQYLPYIHYQLIIF